MTDIGNRIRNVEKAADPYRGVREHTAYTPIGLPARGNVGVLDYVLPVVDSTASGIYHPGGYSLGEDGYVRARGRIAGAQIGAILWTFPAGFRPDKNERFVCATGDPSVFATLEVATDGTVTLIGFS